MAVATGALIAAGGTAAAGLFSGLLASMSGKKNRELQRQQFNINQENNAFNQRESAFNRELGARSAIGQHIGGTADRKAASVGNLINALQRTI